MKTNLIKSFCTIISILALNLNESYANQIPSQTKDRNHAYQLEEFLLDKYSHAVKLRALKKVHIDDLMTAESIQIMLLNGSNIPKELTQLYETLLTDFFQKSDTRKIISTRFIISPGFFSINYIDSNKLLGDITATTETGKESPYICVNIIIHEHNNLNEKQFRHINTEDLIISISKDHRILNFHKSQSNK